MRLVEEWAKNIVESVGPRIWAIWFICDKHWVWAVVARLISGRTRSCDMGVIEIIVKSYLNVWTCTMWTA